MACGSGLKPSARRSDPVHSNAGAKSNFCIIYEVREWREIHRQLWLALKSTARLNTEPADYRSVHQALLTGFIGSVGST